MTPWEFLLRGQESICPFLIRRFAGYPEVHPKSGAGGSPAAVQQSALQGKRKDYCRSITLHYKAGVGKAE